MNRNFFITGGTGLIGRALMRQLLPQIEALGISSITLLTRDPEKFSQLAPDIANHKAVRLLKGDLATVVLPTDSYTDIIHGAADTNDSFIQDRIAYFWDITAGTKRILDFAAQCGCNRFLYLSSGAVYGPGQYPETGIPEDWALAPSLADEKSTYGQAKRASEHLCRLYSKQMGMAVKIARIFAVIGEEMPLDGRYAIGNFIHDALSETSDAITIKGDGTPIRSFLHVDDVAQWLLKIHASDTPQDVFNVGSDISVSIKQLAEIVSKNSPSKKPVVVTQKERDYAGRSVYLPDCTHVRTALGVTQTIDLESAVQKIFTRLQTN
ncbi:MAG TPA: NAD(P)-dependent oxidoreductase [Burkholderiaceae bacterium]